MNAMAERLKECKQEELKARGNFMESYFYWVRAVGVFRVRISFKKAILISFVFRKIQSRTRFRSTRKARTFLDTVTSS